MGEITFYKEIIIKNYCNHFSVENMPYTRVIFIMPPRKLVVAGSFGAGTLRIFVGALGIVAKIPSRSSKRDGLKRIARPTLSLEFRFYDT